jgi:hypothetical protein
MPTFEEEPGDYAPPAPWEYEPELPPEIEQGEDRPVPDASDYEEPPQPKEPPEDKYGPPPQIPSEEPERPSPNGPAYPGERPYPEPPPSRVVGPKMPVQLFDEELTHGGAPVYDAESGRWVQPDSIISEYADPTRRDLVIITGWKTDADYSDPSNWREWVTADTGSATKYDEWYSRWAGTETPPNEWGVSYRLEPSKAEREAMANETGIAVFDWSTVGGSIPGSSADAAKALQSFIDRTGLKDVTIVGHSKGAIAATELLAMYQNGEVDKGAVKNMVLIDPPQDAGMVRFFGGSARPVDATKAGVNVVFLPGLVSSLWGRPRGTSEIENDIEFPYVDDHSIRGDSAKSVFDTLRNRAR